MPHIEKTLKAIRANISSQMKSVIQTLERAKNYPALETALSCNPFVVYQIIGRSHDTLEGFGDLCSIILNGIYDDASLMVVREDHSLGRFPFHTYKITWGSDYERAITEGELIHLFNLKQKRQDYYEENKEAIEGGMMRDENGRRIFSEENREWYRLGDEVKKYFEHLWDLQQKFNEEG